MEALTLRPYAPKPLFMGCASIVLSACFAWVIFDSQPGANISFAYFLATIFFIPASLFVLMLLPGSTFVKADSQGIEVRFLWLRAYALPWREIQGFEFHSMLPASPIFAPFSNVVRVTLTARGKSKNRHTVFQRLTRGRLGNGRGIPDLFSVRGAELARLLNDMRNRYAHAG